MIDSELRSWPAPAKLNLFLHVTGRRDDGYHELQTLFQLIDLMDEVEIEITTSPVLRRLGADYDVAEDEDLVMRAARLLQRHAQVRQGALIRVRKHIPMGAGLGGGSSDAATTLLALNHLWRCGLNLDELARLGLQLGADIPLFVRGRSALAGGIGEILHPVELGERHYVLVFNTFSVATADVFNHALLPRQSATISPQLALTGGGRNDCEVVVRRMHPELAKIMTDLQRWGQPRMTGTGSCIFLPMPDKKIANSTAREIKCRYNVRAVRGVDGSPLHEMLGLTARNN